MNVFDDIRRITVVTGHFGSGKTEFALNYALKLKKMGYDTVIIDFDIVNPYYRTKDAESFLNTNGIEVIAPEFANSNIETPTLPPDILKAFNDKSKHIIFDVGGDEDGATPLGVYYEYFSKEDYNLFFVLNERRMLTQDVEGALDIYGNIERVSRLRFTGIVNNTHIMQYTDADVILGGERLAEEFSAQVNLPVICTCVYSGFADNIPKTKYMVFPMDLFVGPKFNKEH